MLNRIFIECFGNTMQFVPVNSGIEDDFTNESAFDNDEESYSSNILVPQCIYLNPIEDAYPLDIDFDPSGYNFLHVITIDHDIGNNTSDCEIFNVFGNRREAKSSKDEIEQFGTDNLSLDEIHSVSIYTVPVEE